MSVSRPQQLLWDVGLILLCLPYPTLGLLSNYKICGDSECESHMSRVQATRDYHGKDCRYLSFKRGDTIFVFHKLTGRRNDLWAGSIDKQFGYFPKAAVKEEQVYATTENVVETQKFDFFCLDEHGYPTDSSHLDTDDDVHDDDQRNPKQNSESNHGSLDSKVNDGASDSPLEHPLPASVLNLDSARAEREESTENTPGTVENDKPEASEQGGSPGSPSSTSPPPPSSSPPWLGSSVTGWLGLTGEAEVVDSDDEKATDAGDSLAGWLGFGGQQKVQERMPVYENEEKERKEAKDADGSFTSTVTGWLGYGSGRGTEDSKESMQGEEEINDREHEEGEGESFRSRRLALDLDNNQLQEVEEKVPGTFDWLEDGLSSTFRFGRTNDDPEPEKPSRNEQVEDTLDIEEPSASHSWFDIGIANVLGFGKDEGKADKNIEPGLEEWEEGKNLAQPVESENVDAIQTQSTLRDQREEDRDMVQRQQINDEGSDLGQGKETLEKERDTKLIEKSKEEGGIQTESVVEVKDADDFTSDTNESGMVDSGKESLTLLSGRDTESRASVDGDVNTDNLLDGREKSDTWSEVTDQDEVNNLSEKEPQTGFSIGGFSAMLDNFLQQKEDKDGVGDGNGDGDGEGIENEERVDLSFTRKVESEDTNSSEKTGSHDEQDSLTITDSGRGPALNSVDSARQHSPPASMLNPDCARAKGEESTENKPGAVKNDKPEASEQGGSPGKVMGLHAGEDEKNDKVTAEEEGKPFPDFSHIITDSTEDSRETEAWSGDGDEQERDAEMVILNKGNTQSENKFATTEQHQAMEHMQVNRDEGDSSRIAVATDDGLTREDSTKDVDNGDLSDDNVTAKAQETALHEMVSEDDVENPQEDRFQPDSGQARELIHGESPQQPISQEPGTSPHTDINVYENVSEKASEEDKSSFSSTEVEGTDFIANQTLRMADQYINVENTHQAFVSPQNLDLQSDYDAGSLKLAHSKNEDEAQEEYRVEQVPEDTPGFEKEILKEDIQQSASHSKKDTGTVSEFLSEESLRSTSAIRNSISGPVSGMEPSDFSETASKTDGRQAQSLQEDESKEKKQEEDQEVEEKEENTETELNYGEKEEETERREEASLDEYTVIVKGSSENMESDREVPTEDPSPAMVEIYERPSEKIKTLDEGRGESRETLNAGMKEEENEEEVEEVDRDDKTSEEKRKEEVAENQGVESAITGRITEHIPNQSDSEVDSIDDINVLLVTQTGIVEDGDEDQLYSGRVMGGHAHDVILNEMVISEPKDNSGDKSPSQLSNNMVLSPTKEIELPGNNDGLYSRETSSPRLSNTKITTQTNPDQTVDTTDEDKTIEGAEQINTEHDDRSANREDDVMATKDDNTGGSKKAKIDDNSASHSEALISEQTVVNSSAEPKHKDDRSEGGAGAFGLFKNALSFFNPTARAEPQEPKSESEPGHDSSREETSESQAFLSPDLGMNLTDSNPEQKLHVQDLKLDGPTSTSQPQLQPQETSPPPLPYHPDPPDSRSKNPNPESHLNGTTAALAKQYKALCAHVSVEEIGFLMELFGRHKLQWLDYVLSTPETEGEDAVKDLSILLDMERLLDYQQDRLAGTSGHIEDKERSEAKGRRLLTALQKLDMLLARVKEILNTGKSDISNTGHQDETSINDKESSIMGDPSETKGSSDNSHRAGGIGEKKSKTEVKNGGQKEKRKEEEDVSPQGWLETAHPPEGQIKRVLDCVRRATADASVQILAVRDLLKWLVVQVVSALPDDIRPGPDLYGLPWEPVIVTSLVGLVTVLVFAWRCYSSVRSRVYRSKERHMADHVAELLNEKCKVLETLSQVQQEHDELESSMRDSGVLAQTERTEQLEHEARMLERSNREMERDLELLKDQLEQQREHRMQQECRISELEESMKKFEEETKELQSREEQAETTLKVYKMNSERLQRNLESAGEESILLQESNAQLHQQMEGWMERVGELEEEMRRCEVSHDGMLQDVAVKDERIKSLTGRLLSMKGWDSELEEEREGEDGGRETSTSDHSAEVGEGNDTQRHLRKVQKLIYAAKLNADLKSVDEDKDRVFAKLNDEVRAKEDLQEGIKELESEKSSLQSEAEHYTEQVERLQQKLQIMTEMYQENELKLHRLLTVEEKERLQKEEKLTKADRNITLAMEELNNYRQRAEEMEEELQKSKQSYQTQISAHEKKAHNNWLAVRAADRELADIRRENALLRQKLTDTQFKLDAIDKDPYALDSLARPLPYRAERSQYGPSPLGRPASETRPFLSPPTLMEGPPPRLSPRVPRGPGEPPGALREMERSGGPHSDSGSISPTWERERRGPPPGLLGPPGYMFPEPGGPMYRRSLLLPPHLPPPGPLPMGLLPPRGFPPTGPPGPLMAADKAEPPYNSLGPADPDHQEPGPGDLKPPAPDAECRMGDGPPPMGPADGPFPHRPPHRPLSPPDFYPLRGPGGPPMMPMWAAPPPPHPGMMFPPRLPLGGPPLPHPPHPGLPSSSYPPTLRPPLPPHGQLSRDPGPSPHDVI